MDNLLAYIKKYYPISNALQEILATSFTKITVPKNHFLIKEGQYCKHLYFLEKGCLRGFYNVDGKEITNWFGFENNFVTSFHSFITHTPTLEYIHLIEDATLWAINHDTLTTLYKHHEIERLVRLIYENYYIRLEERMRNIHFKTAAERYENLILQDASIVKRMPLGNIASYLGISQETLSRIRNKI
jgi:CRP-like cAMP-binding protein